MNFVIEIILKSSALLIFILCLLSLLKKQSASLRHFLISLTMIGLFSFPLLIFCLPAIELAWLSNRIVPANIPVSITDEPEHFPKSEIAKAPLIINTEPKQLSETAQISQSSISLPSLSALEWIQVTALGISLFFLLRLMVGIYRIRQISFLGKGLHRDDLDEILNRLSPKNQPGNKVKILISPAVQTPMTWGFNQAYILLPESALRWTKEDLFTVLIHEWAHIQRRDYFFHFLAQVATCLYWYNPLFWILKKQQLLEREKACDEFVVNQGVDPNAYARLLLAFARSIQSKTALTHYALPMAKPGQIKQRIIAILDFNPGKVLLSTMAKFKWSFLFAGALPLIATLSLVAKPLPVELKTLLTENELTIIQVSEMVQETPLQDKTLNDQESEASNPAIHDEFNQNENDSLSYSKPVDKLALKTPLLQSEKRPLEQVSAKINGWFGQWEENGHNIKVWTHGEFQTNSDFLYIFPENADGLIVIEVNKGKTSRRIVLTKAPYDGALIQDYKNGEPNAWSGFLRDDLLLMQFKNEECQYSFQNLGF